MYLLIFYFFFWSFYFYIPTLEEEVVIEAFDQSGNYIGSQIDVNARTYLITPKSLLNQSIDRLSLWSPYEDYNGGGTPAQILIQSMIDLTTSENYSLSFELFIAGWNGVVGNPICKEGFPCPDMIILGTTQVASRVFSGETHPLTEYFNDWTLEKSSLWSDDFVRYYFYEFNMLGNWYSLPVSSDLRLLFFNRTTFDELNLKYPPPHDTWDHWSWIEIVEIARIIHEKTGQPGFTFWGEWDEELKLFSIIGREFGAGLFESQTSCGFTSEKWKTAIEKVVKPLWFEGVTNNDFYGDDQETFENWKKTYYENPNDNPHICCKYGNEPIYGMKVGVPDQNRESQINGSAELVESYIPYFSFLGGSGAILTSGGNKKDLSWKYLSFILDPTKTYINELSKAFRSPPPYESLLSTQPWSLPEWHLPSQQIKKSLPIQYPFHSFPQFGQIEYKKPIRLFLMEVMFKNYSIEEASERVCQVINQTFLKNCDENDMIQKISDCDSNSKRYVSYEWNTNSQCNKIESKLLSEKQTISCEYIPFTNWLGIFFAIFLSFFEFIDFCFLFSFFHFRKTNSMRNSSPFFSSLVVLGVILFRISGFFLIDEPNDINCILRVWFLSIGFTCIFSSLLVKLERINHIFNKNDLQIVNISNKEIFLKFLGFIFIDLILILIWTIFGKVGEENGSYYEKGIGNISFKKCNLFGNGMILSIILFNFGLFISNCYISWKIRNISEKGFQEQKFIMLLSYIVLTSALIMIPMLLFIDDQYYKNIISIIIVLVWSSIITLVFVIPKIYRAIYYNSHKNSDQSK